MRVPTNPDDADQGPGWERGAAVLVFQVTDAHRGRRELFRSVAIPTLAEHQMTSGVQAFWDDFQDYIEVLGWEEATEYQAQAWWDRRYRRRRSADS